MPDVGAKPHRLERYLLPFIPHLHPGRETVIIHHLTNREDQIQLEIERKWTENGVVKLSFERIYL